jgi:hypothetical protein
MSTGPFAQAFSARPTAVFPGAAAFDAQMHIPSDAASPLVRPEVAINLRKVLHQIVKAATTAIVLRLLIGLLKSLGKYKITKRTLYAIRDEIFGKDPWKWALVFAGWACFLPLCRLLEVILRPLRQAIGDDNVRQVATIASGVIVAQPIRVMHITTRTELGLYLASRASHSVATSFVYPLLPQTLQNFRHWDVLFVGLSGCQILYALMFAHHTHSPAYLSFLQNCVGWPRDQWDMMAAYYRGQMVPQVIDIHVAKNLPVPQNASCLRDVCLVNHPHTRYCDVHVVTWILRHMLRFSIPLYLPLKIITTFAFGWNKVLRDPVGQAVKVVKSVLMSSLFLSLYCGGPMRVICMLNQVNATNWGEFLMFALGRAACALPTLLEPKSRRLDLALYCNMHAFRSGYLMLAQRGYVPRPRAAHVMALYTASLTILLHFLRFRPQDLHPNLRSGLQFIMGKAGH